MKIRCRCGREYAECKPVCECGNELLVCQDREPCCTEPQWIPGNPCGNRGEVLREMECNCAGGRKIVDVYSCAIHGECTLRNTKAGTDKPHVCLGCDDWTA